MTNEELVIRIKTGIDPEENMLVLYEQVKAFISSIAWKYRGREEIEDLEQEGYLALYDAIDGYDPNTGYKFLTYAESWVRQAMGRYIEKNSSSLRISYQSQARLRKYKRFRDSFVKEYGREPLEAEIAASMGLSIDQVREIHKNACMENLVSLDAPIKGFEEEGFSTGDGIPSAEDMEEETLDRLQQEQLSTVLWECVDSLPGRQPEIIRKRFQDNMTLDAIGESLGVWREAIRQDQSKAFRELRKPRNARRLRPFLTEAEEIYNMGLKGTGLDRFNHTWTSATERAALHFEV
ncbi:MULTISPECIES: sigma-70 family RNA polymerase sigma factor [unclassified Lacrimispora]|uniref:sigma-70 family RNA polymerase sigma factor n=1 Tax=unclassified Lacrimispora TaxID=2719232 RepID=UPI00376F58C0